MNNRSLTYVEAEGGEEEVLTPNRILWGQDVCSVDDTEGSDAEKQGWPNDYEMLRPIRGNTGKGSTSTA